MAAGSGHTRRWVRPLGFGAVALALLLAGLAVAVHTPPARRAVLDRSIATLSDRLNIVLQADNLEYNLFTLRVTLRDVVLSSTTTPRSPFFQAEVVIVDLPWSALYGPFSIERVEVQVGGVTIVRNADGTSNLPPSQESAGESAPVPIDRIDVARLGLRFSDAASGIALFLPFIRAQIEPERGSLRMTQPGSLTRGAEAGEIRTIEGDVRFDGRAVHLRHLAIATGDLAAQIDGRVALFGSEPGVDLQVKGQVDLHGATRWAALAEPRPDGSVAVAGMVRGPFNAIDAALHVESDGVTWENASINGVAGDVRLSTERLNVERLDASFSDGRLHVAGDLRLEDQMVSATVAWSDVDLHRLVRMLAPAAAVRPAGRATGSASIEGPASDLRRINVSARNETRAAAGSRSEIPLNGAAALTLEGGRWALDANHVIASAPVHAALSGRLAGDALTTSTLAGTVEIGETGLRPLLNALAAAGVVSVPQVTAGVIQGNTHVEGTVGAPQFRAQLTGSGVAASGVGGVTLEVIAEGTTRLVTFDAVARQEPGNELAAAGSFTPASQRLDLGVTGRLASPGQVLPDVPFAGIVELAFTGAGPAESLTGRGTVTITELTYDGVALGRLESKIELDDAVARIGAAIADVGARADATVALSAPHNARVELSVADADLGRLVAGRALPVPLAGTVSLTARGDGALDDWTRGTASVEVTRAQLTAGELPIRLAAPAKASYANGVATLSVLDATLGETRLSAAGGLPVLAGAPPVPASETLQMVLTGDLAQTLSAVRATGLVELPPVTGRGPLALLSRVSGSAAAPVVAADLELGPGEVAFADVPPVSRLQLRAHLEDGWLELREAEGEWQGSGTTADGRFPLRLLDAYLPPAVLQALPATTGNASLNVRASGVTPRVLEPFLESGTVTQLEGSVDASLHVDSPSIQLADLTGELRLDRLDVRVAGLPIQQREPTRIVAGGGFARVAAWDWTGEGASLDIKGQVRLEDQQAALLANGRIDLRTLVPFLGDVGVTTGGLLEPRLSVSGPIADPRIDGDIRITGGEVRMADPQIVATDLTGRAVLSRTTGHITSLTGTVNGGSLTGSGQVTFDRGAPIHAQLSAAVRNMAMNVPEGLRTEIDADLALDAVSPAEGPASGAVTGTITVLRGVYREPLALTMGLLGAMRSQQLGATAGGEPDAFANHLRLDVRVLTEEDIAVDNNIGRLQLYGDLRVIGTAAVPSLSGRAELRPDGRLFLGRNIYTLESGTIDFANPDVIEPILDVKAMTRVAGEDISVTIAGTPEDPSVEFTAGNSDLTNADIGALLVTGRTLDELGTADAEFIGRELVLGNLSGEILGFAGRAAGLDSIRLGGVDPSLVRRDPTAVASEVDPTSRLTFGKSLGEHVELTYSQSLVDGDAQTWIVDYLPIRQLDLRVVSDDDDLRSYEFRHDISIGGGRRARADAAPAARTAAKRVSEVTFGGDPGGAEAHLRGLLRLEPGDRFDFLEWQLDRDRLEADFEGRGYREVRIAATRKEAADTVALAYDVTSGSLTAIEVSGFDVPQDTVRAIERAWSASVFDGFLVDEATALVRGALADAGYLRAAVDASIVPGQTKTLAIRVTPGERTGQYWIRIEGPDPALNGDVSAWLAGRGLDRASVRDPRIAEREVSAFLRTRGHLRAVVRALPVSFDTEGATLPVTVDPGTVLTIGDVVVRSAHPLKEGAPTITGLAAGQPYDPAVIDVARERIVAAYRRAGFPDVRVTVEPVIGETQVTVVFDVAEGLRQVLREVLVEGNRSIDADVVVRRLELVTGEPLAPEAWLQARRRVFDTGLFRRVDIVTEPIAAVSPGEQSVRLRVAVEEWPALRVRYGLQVVEERPEAEVGGRDLAPGLTIDVTRRTLFGRAVSVGIAGEVQRRDQEARTFLTAPSIFGWPVESSLSMGWTRRPFAGSSRIDERTGISAEQRIPVGRNVRLSYGYQLERSSTETLNDPVLGSFTVSVQTARLTAAAARDTRDDPTNSTRGSLFSLSLEYAPEALGSELRFVRMLGQAYRFQGWRDVVFASAARIGSARAFDDQELLGSERFFAGGARTVRGAAEDGLGPSDFFGPLGGEGLVVLNQEVRFPIYRWVRGVGFADVGNVFPRLGDFRFGDLVGSAGAGLRITTPFGILRADYGRLWSRPDSGDQAGQFIFGLGHIF